MKLAISNIAWLADEDADVFALLADHGVTALEIAPTRMWGRWEDISRVHALRTREVLREAGLECVAMQSLLYGLPDLQVFGGRESRARLARHLIRMGQLATDVGASKLVFGSPKNRQAGDLPPDMARATAAEVLGPAAEELSRLGVALCIEANPPEYECDFVTTIADAVALARLIDSPGFRVHLDAGGLHLTGEPVADAVKSAAPFLSHVHISEPFLAQPDASNTTHEDLAAALRACKYSGYCSIEMRRNQADVLDAVRDAFAVARAVYGD